MPRLPRKHGRMTTGDALRRKMALKGYSSRRLSMESGVSESTIRRLMQTDMTGNLATWTAILAVLDTDINEIMGGTDG